MKIVLSLLLLSITTVPAYAQNKKSNEVSGNCNGTATGSNITVTVRCEDGLSAEQSKALASQYASIIRAIRQGDVSQNRHFDEMMTHLKSVEDGITKLQTATMDRHLTPDEIQQLSTVGQQLTVNPGVLKFDYYGTNPESASYALDFQKGLGLDPNKASFTAMTSNPVSGVRLAFSQEDVASQHAPTVCAQLVTFFEQNKIPIMKGIAAWVTSGHCELLIGFKPTS